MAMLEASQGRHPGVASFENVIRVCIRDNFGRNVLNALFTSLPPWSYPHGFHRMRDRNLSQKSACRQTSVRRRKVETSKWWIAVLPLMGVRDCRSFCETVA